MQYILLIGSVLIILLFAIVVILSYIIKDNSKQIATLKHDNELLSKNVTYLVHFSETISKMRKEKEELNEEILQAESPEEISDIIARIISNNNTRVQNNK